jgi:uncharacterized spore protein YtfJ
MAQNLKRTSVLSRTVGNSPGAGGGGGVGAGNEGTALLSVTPSAVKISKPTSVRVVSSIIYWKLQVLSK